MRHLYEEYENVYKTQNNQENVMLRKKWVAFANRIK